MKKPAVSVIMPAFNSETLLPRAIESILNQTFKNFELIIIDDCSSDNTYKIAKKYQRKDKRIRVIRNNKNLQIARCLNKGINLARGEFIARMDADDVAYRKRLEIQYRYLINHPSIAIVGANILIIDRQGKIFSKRVYPQNSDDLKKLMFRYSPFAHPVVMYKKKIVKDFGCYDETKVPCEDIDLWFKIGSVYDFGSIPKFLLKYTLLFDSNSHKRLKRVELMGLKIKLNAIKKYGYRPSCYDIIYNVLEFLTLWFTPSVFRIKLYDFLRSRKLI